MDYFVHTHSGEEQGSHFTPLALPSALLPMGPPATVKLPDGKFPAKKLNGRLLTEKPSNHSLPIRQASVGPAFSPVTPVWQASDRANFPTVSSQPS